LSLLTTLDLCLLIIIPADDARRFTILVISAQRDIIGEFAWKTSRYQALRPVVVEDPCSVGGMSKMRTLDFPSRKLRILNYSTCSCPPKRLMAAPATAAAKYPRQPRALSRESERLWVPWRVLWMGIMITVLVFQ
jgi:hypothetical protein